MEDDCWATQLIDGNGDFNVQGLENFTKKVKLAECGLSYAVVAIMGPQSSGTSVFHCSFLELRYSRFCILFSLFNDIQFAAVPSINQLKLGFFFSGVYFVVSVLV
jgi:hypothetical protein